MNSRFIGGFLAALSCSAVFMHALADGEPGSQYIPVLCGGAVVCRVTPPSLGAGASIEAKELDGGLAWRIRYDGEGERTIEEETWTFDFGDDLRCWPVSHAQGEYVPKTISTIAEIAPMPDQYRGDGAGKGRSYEHLIEGSAESPSPPSSAMQASRTIRAFAFCRDRKEASSGRSWKGLRP